MAKGGINWRQIYLCSKFMQIVSGRLIIEGGIMLTEYGIKFNGSLISALSEGISLG